MSQPPAGNIRVVKVLAALFYILCVAAVMQTFFSFNSSFLPEVGSHHNALNEKKKNTNVFLII